MQKVLKRASPPLCIKGGCHWSFEWGIYSINASKEFDSILFTNVTLTGLRAERGDSGGIAHDYLQYQRR